MELMAGLEIFLQTSSLLTTEINGANSCAPSSRYCVSCLVYAHILASITLLKLCTALSPQAINGMWGEYANIHILVDNVFVRALVMDALCVVGRGYLQPLLPYCSAQCGGFLECRFLRRRPKSDRYGAASLHILWVHRTPHTQSHIHKHTQTHTHRS